MEMKNYIEQAERKAGKQVELAKTLGVTAGYLRAVKAGKKGLSADMCIVLADYIGADRLEVIAASNLVTEKDEKKRKIFESCFSTSRAASFTVTALFIGVILIMTPSSAHASWATVSDGSMFEYFVLCKINNVLLKARQKIHKLLSSLSFISNPFRSFTVC